MFIVLVSNMHVQSKDGFFKKLCIIFENDEVDQHIGECSNQARVSTGSVVFLVYPSRAFTLRTVGFNHLILGHNHMMELLGDSNMKLEATEYFFIHFFPDHHDGHLTQICSSLINNHMQLQLQFAINQD